MEAHGRSSGSRWLVLSPGRLLLASLVLFAADWGTRQAGDTVFAGGPLDELAHVLTTLLVFWALGGRRGGRYLTAALVASVAIDIDHLPDRLGWDGLTAGTPRPYTHSLLTIAAAALLAWLWSRRRDLWIGVAIGLTIHFARDMTEGGAGVSLLWPLTDHSFALSHGLYVGAMGVAIAIAAARCYPRAPKLPMKSLAPRASRAGTDDPTSLYSPRLAAGPDRRGRDRARARALRRPATAGRAPASADAERRRV